MIKIAEKLDPLKKDSICQECGTKIHAGTKRARLSNGRIVHLFACSPPEPIKKGNQ